MKLKNTTGEGRKICDGDRCILVKNGEIFEVSDALGAQLITQGFTEVKESSMKTATKPKTTVTKGDKD